MSTYKKTRVQHLEVAPPRHAKAPWIIDDFTLAFRLGISGRALWRLIVDKQIQYTVFHVPKKSGKGKRMIHAPSPHMKRALRSLCFRILHPLQEDLGPHVAAYRPGKSTKDAWIDVHYRDCPECDAVAPAAAAKHDCPRKGVKVHFDIKDFFNTTRRATVRSYFVRKVGYSHEVADLLANLLTVPVTFRKRDMGEYMLNLVPQGAPTSGAICNLVADWLLDTPILRALEELNEKYGYEDGRGWAYTRYADDLAFSHSENLDRDKVNELIRTVRACVKDSPWDLNTRKTTVRRPHRKQRFLGMTVNAWPNPDRTAYRTLRAILHNALYHGWDAQVERDDALRGSVGELQAHIQGMIAYYRGVNADKADKLQEAYDAAVHAS